MENIQIDQCLSFNSRPISDLIILNIIKYIDNNVDVICLLLSCKALYRLREKFEGICRDLYNNKSYHYNPNSTTASYHSNSTIPPLPSYPPLLVFFKHFQSFYDMGYYQDRFPLSKPRNICMKAFKNILVISLRHCFIEHYRNRCNIWDANIPNINVRTLEYCLIKGRNIVIPSSSHSIKELHLNFGHDERIEKELVLEDGTIPHGVQKLVLWYYHGPVTRDNIPDSVTELTLLENIKQVPRTAPFILPPNLKVLTWSPHNSVTTAAAAAATQIPPPPTLTTITSVDYATHQSHIHPFGEDIYHPRPPTTYVPTSLTTLALIMIKQDKRDIFSLNNIEIINNNQDIHQNSYDTKQLLLPYNITTLTCCTGLSNDSGGGTSIILIEKDTLVGGIVRLEKDKLKQQPLYLNLCGARTACHLSSVPWIKKTMI
ncbi:hypothetical protein DFA_07894 [Cavenderia fasciculata]|uniref:Uncharacterized protein n=1 Tax=Cavenderia fasciculata TaxID=261658 RepID=F4Q3Z9_CACFS|nr:uncharacterized protein DFA_07894 [Cavenderia fasciculata]EGG16913.1 hypothetical protein DFA_07894 [Cavenderia fasciculata]|eukprot:XP_004355387.1 hypothetical protein DFA_07894 [Cavenderia fasciculata]